MYFTFFFPKFNSKKKGKFSVNNINFYFGDTKK